MSLIDTYISNIARKKEELARLSKDKASEAKKVADYRARAISAQKSASNTKSLSTMKSKLLEATRYEKNCVDCEKKVACIEDKIARKNKEIATEEKKYQAEKNRVDRRAMEEHRKRLRESERQAKKVEDSIARHDREYLEIKKDIIELRSVPDKITVLFLASNPNDTSQLMLGEEARDIQNMIRLSEHRDSVNFETRWAVRATDIFQAINETNPTVIHFSGHGDNNGNLILQNPDSSHKLISPEAMAQTMSVASNNIRLVFFNTCFSQSQSEAVVDYIEAAIGMNDSIGDEAARIFSAQFYSAIGFGLSLNEAFKQAKGSLILESIREENTPVLNVKSGFEPDEIYLVSGVNNKN